MRNPVPPRRSRLALAFALAFPTSCALITSYDGYEHAGQSAAGTGSVDGAAGDGGEGALGTCFPVGCGTASTECGAAPDGCGMTIQCPACQGGKLCFEGKCVPPPTCGNTVCEPGETCASCNVDCDCTDGVCQNGECCKGSCTGLECGLDACGSLCAYCLSGNICELGKCKPAQTCGNTICEAAAGETCENCSDCSCNGTLCVNGACCPAGCGTNVCGPDPCGNDCGTCPTGQICSKGQCETAGACPDGVCDPSETCNSCPQDCPCDATCTASGCCTPDCAGKVCGADTCGGSCGTCPAGQGCTVTGQCLTVGCGDNVCNGGETCASCPGDCTTGCCVSSCGGNTCGPDNCGTPNACGSCPSGQICNGTGCAQTSGCGNMVCDGGENCATCPGDCPTPQFKKCCNGQIKNCCVQEDCPGDPSLCLDSYCNSQGNCQIVGGCLTKDCCNEGRCAPCGTGGISGFGGIGFY